MSTSIKRTAPKLGAKKTYTKTVAVVSPSPTALALLALCPKPVL